MNPGTEGVGPDVAAILHNCCAKSQCDQRWTALASLSMPGFSRQQARQRPHVVEHDRARACQRLSRREAAGVPERAHPGGPGGLDAVAAVLDHRAAGRVGAESGRRMEEEVRGRLAVLDVLGAEDAAREAVEQAGEAQGVAQPLVRAAGGDACGCGDRVERLDHAVHGLELRSRTPRGTCERTRRPSRARGSGRSHARSRRSCTPRTGRRSARRSRTPRAASPARRGRWRRSAPRSARCPRARRRSRR